MAAITPVNTRQILNNSIKNNNRVKLSLKNGVVSGNIYEPPTIVIPPAVVCEVEGLDFSCADNSEYIAGI